MLKSNLVISGQKFVTKEKYREVKSSRYVTSVKLENYQEENCGD